MWHERMGHLNWEAIKCTRHDNSPLLGIRLNASEPHGTCEGCIAGKAKQRIFKSSPTSSSSEPLELIHADLVGPAETMSIGGHRYAFVLVCDNTKHVWTFFMKSKDETLRKFKVFVSTIEKLTGLRLKIFRSDRGGEFMSDAFTEFLEENGITRQTSAPWTPQQNGTAERMNQTLIGGARTMLQHAGLSKGFWAEAMATATHILNRSLRKGLDWKTPHELLFGRVPDISYLRVFGCCAWVHVSKDQKEEWDSNAKPVIFIGYEPGSKAFRLWDPSTHSVVVSASVRFNESEFPNCPRSNSPVAGPSAKVPITAPPTSDRYITITGIADEDPPPPPPTKAPSTSGPSSSGPPRHTPTPPPSPSDSHSESDSDSESPRPQTPERPPPETPIPSAPRKPT